MARSAGRGLLRYDARRDKNEAEIIEALRWQGASVQSLSAKGVPDLLVGYLGKNYLIEVKSKGKGLNANQREWHNNWDGEIHVVSTAEEALAVLEI